VLTGCGAQRYKLGDPTAPETNLGPVVSVASAGKIRKQVADAGALRRHSVDSVSVLMGE
jgi:acyl-CoA reductase-like NAD-dependent aldehyde dehydrogenase